MYSDYCVSPESGLILTILPMWKLKSSWQVYRWQRYAGQIWLTVYMYSGDRKIRLTTSYWCAIRGIGIKGCWQPQLKEPYSEACVEELCRCMPSPLRRAQLQMPPRAAVNLKLSATKIRLRKKRWGWGGVMKLIIWIVLPPLAVSP